MSHPESLLTASEVTVTERTSLTSQLGTEIEIAGLDAGGPATVEIAIKRRGEELRRLRVRRIGNGRASFGTPQHLVGLGRERSNATTDKFSRAVDVIGNLLFAAIVALGIATITGTMTLQVVTSDSMKPTLNVGDLVVAVSDDLKPPAIGDIVIFAGTKLDGSAIGPYAHRVVDGSAAAGWVTRGDNNPSADPFVSSGTEIRGSVALVIPGIGRIFEPRVLLIVLGGLAVLLLLR